MKPEIKKTYYADETIYHESYYLNGEQHREDGPACIQYYEDGTIQVEVYYLRGKLHREDGPAYIWYFEDGSIESKWYYIKDEYITDEFQILVINGLGMEIK